MLALLKTLAQNARTHVGFRLYAVNTSWMFAEQMLRMVAGLLVGIWVARYLGPVQFGLFSYSIAFAVLFSAISQLGLNSIVVRELIKNPRLKNINIGTAFWLKLFSALVMLAIVAIAVQFTENSEITKLYILIVASGSIFQSFEVIDFYFQSKVIVKYVSICKIIQLTVSSLFKIYLIYKQSQLLPFVIIALLDQVTLALSLYIAYRYKSNKSFFKFFSLKIAKKLIQNGLPLMMSGLVIGVYTRIDQIMIKEILGEDRVGVYSAAVRLSEIWYVAPSIIVSSIFPSIINAKKYSNHLYQQRIRRLYFIMLWLAVGVSVVLTPFSKTIILTLYGEQYAEAANVLTIHIWTCLFVFLGVASSAWYTAENLQKFVLLNTIAGAFANVVLNIYLIPLYGVEGAAFATVIAQAISSYLMNLAFKETRPNFFRLTAAFYKTR